MPKDCRKDVAVELEFLKTHDIGVISIPSDKEHNRVLYQIVKYKSKSKGSIEFEPISKKILTCVELRAYIRGYFDISNAINKKNKK